jgi:hypothetical protein
VIEALADEMLFRGTPEHIHSDNGPEFVAVCTMRYLSDVRIGRINPQHFKFALERGTESL